MMRYELFLALRYLRARRKQAFTSIVSFVSVLGIAVGVAALVIALALLTGFQQDIQTKIIDANAHIVLWGFGDVPMVEYPEVVSTAISVPGGGAGGSFLPTAYSFAVPFKRFLKAATRCLSFRSLMSRHSSAFSLYLR